MRRISVLNRAAILALALVLPALAAQSASADGVTVMFGDNALPPILRTTASATWTDSGGPMWASIDGGGAVASTTSGKVSFTTPAYRPCSPYDVIQVTVQDAPADTFVGAGLDDVEATRYGDISINCSGVMRSFPYLVQPNIRADNPDPSWSDGQTILEADLLRFTGSDQSWLSFSWETDACNAWPPTNRPGYCYGGWGLGDSDYSEIVHHVG